MLNRTQSYSNAEYEKQSKEVIVSLLNDIILPPKINGTGAAYLKKANPFDVFETTRFSLPEEIRKLFLSNEIFSSGLLLKNIFWISTSSKFYLLKFDPPTDEFKSVHQNDEYEENDINGPPAKIIFQIRIPSPIVDVFIVNSAFLNSGRKEEPEIPQNDDEKQKLIVLSFQNSVSLFLLEPTFCGVFPLNCSISLPKGVTMTSFFVDEVQKFCLCGCADGGIRFVEVKKENSKKQTKEYQVLLKQFSSKIETSSKQEQDKVAAIVDDLSKNSFTFVVCGKWSVKQIKPIQQILSVEYQGHYYLYASDLEGYLTKYELIRKSQDLAPWVNEVIEFQELKKYGISNIASIKKFEEFLLVYRYNFSYAKIMYDERTLEDQYREKPKEQRYELVSVSNNQSNYGIDFFSQVQYNNGWFVGLNLSEKYDSLYFLQTMNTYRRPKQEKISINGFPSGEQNDNSQLDAKAQFKAVFRNIKMGSRIMRDFFKNKARSLKYDTYGHIFNINEVPNGFVALTSGGVIHFLEKRRLESQDFFTVALELQQFETMRTLHFFGEDFSLAIKNLEELKATNPSGNIDDQIKGLQTKQEQDQKVRLDNFKEALMRIKDTTKYDEIKLASEQVLTAIQYKQQEAPKLLNPTIKPIRRTPKSNRNALNPNKVTQEDIQIDNLLHSLEKTFRGQDPTNEYVTSDYSHASYILSVLAKLENENYTEKLMKDEEEKRKAALIKAQKEKKHKSRRSKKSDDKKEKRQILPWQAAKYKMQFRSDLLEKGDLIRDPFTAFDI